MNRHFCLLSAACLVAVAALVNGQQFDENSVGQDFDYSSFEEPQPSPTPIRVKGQQATRGRNNFAAPAQNVVTKPPVTILKQINRHNEDGSYTYGFEGSDGSFKIETKAANGEVKGKYGYVDDSGKVRVVEYGANKYGFQPNGEGITVPPPTLVDETKKQKKVVISAARPAFSAGFSGAIPVSEEPEYDDGQLVDEQRQVQAQPQPQQFPSRNTFESRTPSRVVVQTRARPIVRPAAPVNVARPSPNFDIPRPSANFQFGTDIDSGSFQQEQTFGSQSRFQEEEESFEVPSRSSGGSPVPARAQVAGAAPVSTGPAPPRIVVAGAAPAPVQKSSSRASQTRPAPQFLFPQARQATRATARQFVSSASSSFDELEKQYALPSGGAATHDVTFSTAF